ncbi:hypothetical protein E2C01_047580 [Portunus trituberculatus]|uniref:Uncharacterized protein n=1 Tax=Portunus trituberculatus TaxID=210409 RepID=A0A5B7G8Y2_PORTR|nr:hypothetical protein [Portunus trituberculatus]
MVALLSFLRPRVAGEKSSTWRVFLLPKTTAGRLTLQDRGRHRNEPGALVTLAEINECETSRCEAGRCEAGCVHTQPVPWRLDVGTGDRTGDRDVDSPENSRARWSIALFVNEKGGAGQARPGVVRVPSNGTTTTTTSTTLLHRHYDNHAHVCYIHHLLAAATSAPGFCNPPTLPPKVSAGSRADEKLPEPLTLAGRLAHLFILTPPAAPHLPAAPRRAFLQRERGRGTANQMNCREAACRREFKQECVVAGPQAATAGRPSTYPKDLAILPQKPPPQMHGVKQLHLAASARGSLLRPAAAIKLIHTGRTVSGAAAIM